MFIVLFVYTHTHTHTHTHGHTHTDTHTRTSKTGPTHTEGDDSGVLVGDAEVTQKTRRKQFRQSKQTRRIGPRPAGPSAAEIGRDGTQKAQKNIDTLSPYISGRRARRRRRVCWGRGRTADATRWWARHRRTGIEMGSGGNMAKALAL